MANNIFQSIGDALKKFSDATTRQTTTPKSTSNAGSSGSVYSAPNNPTPKINTTPVVTNPYGVGSYNIPKTTQTTSAAKTTTPSIQKQISGATPVAPPSSDPLYRAADYQKQLADQGVSGNVKVNPVNRDVNVTFKNKDGSQTFYNDRTGEYNVLPSTAQLKAYMDQVGNDDGSNGDEGPNGAGLGDGQVPSYYNDLMAAFMERNAAARDAAIDAILANLDAVRGTYKNQIKEVIDEYQSLIDQNEIAKERTRKRIREDQANRGQLDGGMGRQERLNLDMTYDTNTANLNAAREKAVSEIMSLIAQAEAEANTNKANVENQYNNAEIEYMLANQ